MTTGAPRRFAPRVAAVVALLACVRGTTAAHEMGASRALLTFHRDGTFTLEVVVDPRNLLSQLAIGAREAAVDREPTERGSQLRAQLARVSDGIELYFDDRRSPAAIDFRNGVNAVLAAGLPSGVGDAGTLHLTGRVPADARQFSFAYRWTYGAMPLLVRDDASSEPQVVWIGPGERSPRVSLTSALGPGRLAVARQYLLLGFTHILPLGIDHIMFVLGLFFLSAGWRALLLQVSTFTIAHTMTLGLTMLGIVSVSASIVEPLIALSIAYVAIENLLTRQLRPSRLVLIFCFGLLHGMGFAGVLTELGLPPSRFLEALLSFNAGVEFGQIAVLIAATAAVAGWRQRESSLLPLVAQPASMLIAASGVYWTVLRVIQ